MDGIVTMKVMVVVALLGILTLAQGTTWLAPKGILLSRTPALQERLHNPVMGPEDIQSKKSNTAGKLMACLECELAAVVLKNEIAAGMNLTSLVSEGIIVCIEVLAMTSGYCVGYVPMIMPIIYHILTNNEVDPKDACGEMFSYLGCTTDDPDREWSVTLHGDKPPVVPVIPPEPDAPKMKVLHLADIHLDPYYMSGSNAACPMDLCCREESGDALNEDDKAWFWGDYRHCGTPTYLLEDLFTHAANTHPDIDYIVWTGDAVPHNMWSTNPEYNKQIIAQVTDMIQSAFPDIPVFPVVGNHEMSPLDQFPEPDSSPDNLSAGWLYETLANQWIKSLPVLDVSTVKYAAYYSVLVRPSFRIISFNSMYGYGSNMWLVANSRDPASELEWLENELSKAEAAGELVHLLGHIPPGLLNMERTWSREYNRIIIRYENIIRGQFFGHTHYDEFEVFHDGERPISVAYIAPSQTPWYDLNPAYRIYYIDGDRPDSTRSVLDHETYVMNLTEAHETTVARWYKLYSAKDIYAMENLTPQDWQNLAEKMADDRNLFDIYFKNYVSDGDPYLEVGCDDICYQQRLCDMVTSNRNDLDHCTAILKRNQKF